MKNIYETPEMELIFLESEDTICTSDVIDVESESNEIPAIP